VITEGAFVHVGNLMDGELLAEQLFVFNDILVVVTITGVVGTSGNARLATYAEVLVNQDNPFGRFVGCTGGTCVITGRILAVHAQSREENPSHIITLSDFGLFNLGSPLFVPIGGLVFLGARRHAGVATYAGVEVYYKDPVWHFFIFNAHRLHLLKKVKRREVRKPS
jgi:hypothetical protein